MPVPRFAKCGISDGLAREPDTSIRDMADDDEQRVGEAESKIEALRTTQARSERLFPPPG